MDMRDFPELEAFGGGPIDGRRVPVAGLEVVVLQGGYAWVYHVEREDDGSRFLRLSATLPLTRAA